MRFFEFKEEIANFEIGKILAHAIKQETAPLPLPDQDFYIMKQKLIETYPKYYAEVCDRARGARIDEDKYLLNLSHEINARRIEKYTNIIVKTQAGILHGHNEDGYIVQKIR